MLLGLQGSAIYGEVLRKPQEFRGCRNQRRSILLVVQWDPGGLLSDDSTASDGPPVSPDADDHEARGVPFRDAVGSLRIID